jgi:hypothetical protein
MNYSHNFGVNFIAKPPEDDYFRREIKTRSEIDANRKIYSKSSRGLAGSQGYC